MAGRCRDRPGIVIVPQHNQPLPLSGRGFDRRLHHRQGRAYLRLTPAEDLDITDILIDIQVTIGQGQVGRRDPS